MNDVDDLIEEDVRVARSARRVARAEANPTRAAVERFEESRRRLRCIAGELRAVPVAGPDIDNVGVGRINRYRAGFADAERRRSIEDWCPGRAAIPCAPNSAPRRADEDDVGVVRVDGDGGDLAIRGDRALIDGARADGCPDGSVQAHHSPRFSIGCSCPGAGCSPAPGFADDRVHRRPYQGAGQVDTTARERAHTVPASAAEPPRNLRLSISRCSSGSSYGSCPCPS